MEAIGSVICRLRKEKGITQEELGKNVGVSTQAVSKWECGGVPDTELIPLIADYFKVSIDTLFGRNIMNYFEADAAIAQKIAAFPLEERFKELFKLAYVLVNAASDNCEDIIPLAQIDRKYQDADLYSQLLTDGGFTLMHINNSLPYFFVMPEVEGRSDYLLKGSDFPSLFRLLADEDSFRSLILLYRRESRAFTAKLLVKTLHMAEEKAEEVLSGLKAYSLVEASEIELDDVVQTVYYFRPNPSFVAFLIFAREMIKKPENFTLFTGMRRSPYLK
jgi:transcriptional regulator with XRE-family HTH domain